MKKVTIKEVAKRAGVGIATVSRVLNNNYPVRDQVKENVLNAIRELDYQPNGIARSLKNKKTNTIGVIVADISNAFFMQIAKGIESVVYNHGYNLIIASTSENPEKELQVLRALSEKRVDAMIISPCSSDGKFIKQLTERGMPIVLVDRKIPSLSIDLIVEDNFSASYKLVSYLISNGHKKIAIMNGLNFVSSGLERFEGYKKALEDNGIAIRNEYILEGAFQKENAYEKIKEMLDKYKPEQLPTAIFAANNLMAEGAMIALYERNMRIPEDISLVSFGDIGSSELIKPKLTVISQKAFDMGQKAGEIVIKRITNDNNLNSDSYKEIVIVSDMYIGQSVSRLT
jgi:LacI family transcriptional regulator